MKRKVLILKPRLDLPFKRFGLKIPKKEFEPISVHWQNFVDKLHEYHTMRHDRVVIVEEEQMETKQLFNCRTVLSRYSICTSYRETSIVW